VSWFRRSPDFDIEPDANAGTKSGTRIKEKLVPHGSEIRIVAGIMLGRSWE